MAHPKPDPQRIQTLQMLHEQAVDHAQQLAVALRQVHLDQRQALDKHQNLVRFIGQYREQLDGMLAQTGSWARVRDMRAFIARLEGALAAQGEEVRRIEAVRADKTREWAAARQREKAFEVLLGQQRISVAAHAREQELHEIQEWTLNASAAFQNSKLPGIS